MCGVEKYLQNTWALVQASKSLHTFWQHPTTPNDEYIKLFNARVTVLTTLGGHLLIHKALVLAKLETMGISAGDLENPEERPDQATYVNALESAQKEYLALLTLSGANAARFPVE